MPLQRSSIRHSCRRHCKWCHAFVCSTVYHGLLQGRVRVRRRVKGLSLYLPTYKNYIRHKATRGNMQSTDPWIQFGNGDTHRYVVDHGIENNLHTCPMDNNAWTVSEGQLDG